MAVPHKFCSYICKSNTFGGWIRQFSALLMKKVLILADKTGKTLSQLQTSINVLIPFI